MAECGDEESAVAEEANDQHGFYSSILARHVSGQAQAKQDQLEAHHHETSRQLHPVRHGLTLVLVLRTLEQDIAINHETDLRWHR